MTRFSFPPNQSGPLVRDYSQNATRGTARSQTRGAAEFLRAHDKMAAILPGVTRMVALQKACATALPAMFDECAVLQFDGAQIVLSIPNAALAAKLKQQLPKLQEALQLLGWQVNSIRLKVQVAQQIAKPIRIAPPVLPPSASSAFALLDAALNDEPRNQALKAAIEMLVTRKR
jgi:hypothetical protein